MPVSKKTIKHPHINLVPEDTQPITVLAENIRKIADTIDEIQNSGLTRDAIVLLLHDATKVNKRDIIAILEAAPKLKERYLQPDSE